MRLEALVFATLLCAVSFAQQDVYRVGAGVTAPVLISKQEPQYSEAARIAKLQGSVVLSLVIGEDGQARDIRAVKSLGLGLDETAIAAVANWKFTPGTRGGQPVAVMSNVEVSFRLLLNPREWSLASAQFTVPPGATPPTILSAHYPPATDLPEEASVRVAFDVDSQGMPVNIQVETSSDSKWNDEVIALIREWRFQAALNNGPAVESHAVFDLTRGLPVPAGRPPVKKQY